MAPRKGPVEPVPSTPEAPAEKVCTFGPNWFSRPLKSGCKGDDVRVVQRKMGCTDTGLFDEATKNALNRWLYAKALPQDGVVDVNVAKAMGDAAVGGWFIRTLRVTPVPMEGPDVKWVQTRLGYSVNGRYDLETSKRVKGFQKLHRLPVTGNVDVSTAERMVVLLQQEEVSE